MNRIIQPFGQLAREIHIKADVNGIIIVEAYNHRATVDKRLHQHMQITPMDAREMVLALIKVVQDYTAVLFAGMGEGLIGAMKSNGQANQDNDNPGKSG
jgi:hypothetical protein